MDFVNKVQSFEEVQMINPFKEDSISQMKANLQSWIYSKLVYPRRCYKFTNDETMIVPPRMIFIPSKSVIRTMVKANLMYGETDTLEQFLLRFGLLDSDL